MIIIILIFILTIKVFEYQQNIMQKYEDVMSLKSSQVSKLDFFHLNLFISIDKIPTIRLNDKNEDLIIALENEYFKKSERINCKNRSGEVYKIAYQDRDYAVKLCPWFKTDPHNPNKFIHDELANEADIYKDLKYVNRVFLLEIISRVNFIKTILLILSFINRKVCV